MAEVTNSHANFLDGAMWKDSSAFLNWPGVEYLFYTKIKPFYAAIDASIAELRRRIDDEDFGLYYNTGKDGEATDASIDENGNVYINYHEGNTILTTGTDDTLGTIDSDGTLKLKVSSDSHISEEGSYIDPVDGKVYVTYE